MFGIGRTAMVGLILAIIGLSLVNGGCTGSQQRGLKSFKANVAGGLDRTVTLYDYNGKQIRQWNGKIDISESQVETDFLVDGKKVVIHGGITVIEEK